MSMKTSSIKPTVGIKREDIIKLGQISNMNISEEEIPQLIAKLEAVLSYASYLKEIAEESQASVMPKQINVLRPDAVIDTPEEPLLKGAPQREENYFVVPMILKN